MGLLILERKIGEWVHVGPDVKVLLHDVRGKRAWLGFDAPRTVEILRDDAAERETKARFIMTEEQCMSLKRILDNRGIAGVNTPDELCGFIANEIAYPA